MRLEFLQFLEPIEIFKISLLCKEINKAIDPLRHQNESNRGTMHLKLVFAKQFLHNHYDLKYPDIDKAFGCDI